MADETATPPLGQQGSPGSSHGLLRTMGLFSLIVYGVGDMVGAGIYGTIGEAAGAMGNAVWMAFVASMMAALFTGLSYASIASRYPRAAGASFVTQHAFHSGFLSFVIGLTVAASGLTSMATSSNVFAKNLNVFVSAVPVTVILLTFIAALTLLNFWGMRESLWMNLLCTTVEVGGLLFIIAVGARFWGSVDYFEIPPTPTGEAGDLGLWMIMSGAVLTFFSFVGFEDMLNVGEEVKNPKRTMPWGIVIALLVATVLYIAVSVTAVSVVSYRDLPNTQLGAPLVQITNRAAPSLSPWVFTGITLFAVGNTALINFIMGSRLIYGMSRQGLLPAVLGRVHPGRRTPHVAIFALMAVVVALALVGDISQLAAATALLLLGCFCVVNAALIVLKFRAGEPRGYFEVPWIVPALGILCCCGLIAARVTRTGAGWKAPAIAGGIVVGIALLYAIVRPRAISEETFTGAMENVDSPER